MSSPGLVLRPLLNIPSITAGDDLAEIAVAAVAQIGETLQSGDVLVFAQKVVSKAEGRAVELATVLPSERAQDLGRQTGLDHRLVELILSESTAIVRQRRELLIVQHRLGFILANAGIDASNVGGDGRVLLLPSDPDASATRLRYAVRQSTGADVGVLIIDSWGRPWRLGTVGCAIGLSGLPGLIDMRGWPDLNGRPLQRTEVGFADELAAAASILMGQAAEGRPIVLVRGLSDERRDGTARELLRPESTDLFR
jgi:coenzyme F420-0:L-glutamate ligase/coenzyme F420-1:gamma-L-glutamate ligase